MPNRNVSYYDIDDVTGTVGPGNYGVTATFTGYGEGGGIEIEPEAPLHEKTVGAAGHVAISKNNDESVLVTVTCMASTALARDLSTLAKSQYNSNSPVGVPFVMRDPHSGDEIQEKEAWFSEFPGPTKEDTQSEREFEIILPHGRKNIIHASNILV